MLNSWGAPKQSSPDSAWKSSPYFCLLYVSKIISIQIMASHPMDVDFSVKPRMQYLDPWLNGFENPLILVNLH